ncbi:nicotinate-nucleotide adenylyltransferase [Alkalimarinus alittae]|uniref:Probable nicotinate-nucleotide adenylyltransferase n=1 Tax=Alkalimarinus alittae TaxID=2961619 RepID=A0ABY6N0A3_9ALTE|nr:nicotinate-nucleotide adenylyltransferase [Alkalimarinus alittae]UZE95525.1 nicotinate-nucleotide adenylyltransferase [Alkalimarinus alittae]
MKIVMGGTYDPVHLGHLRAALELSELFKSKTKKETNVHLLPCYNPVHRGQPGASSAQRTEMLRLATEGESNVIVDQREILRGGPSYTADTLKEMRAQYGDDEPIVLVLGTDAFNGLSSWHQWLEIPTLAHIIVLNRPSWELSIGGQLKDLVDSCRVEKIEALFECAAGYILPLELSLLDISSSKVRSSISKGLSARYLVSDVVWRYICDNQLYGYDDKKSCY